MKRIALLCLLVSFIVSGAYASTYPDATGNWNDPCNWNPVGVPIDNGNEIKISTADGITITVNSNVGTYTTTKIDTARDCTLYVTTGGFIGGGREWHIGDAGMSGDGTDIGYMVQDGGTVDVSASGKMFVGYKTGGNGTYTISGGTLTASGDNGRLYVGSGNTAGATGKFYVDGDDASISFSGNMYIASSSTSSDDDVGNAKVQFDLDELAVSEIGVGSVSIDPGGGGYAQLIVNTGGDPGATVLLIDNASDGGAVVGEFDDIVVNGNAGRQHVIGANYYWLSYSYGDDNNDIALVLVPEPATLIMLAIGGLIATKRRK